MIPLKLSRKHINEIKADNQKVIGFWGAPPADALRDAADKFPGVPFFDLDIYFGVPSTKTLPDAYCHIIRNCVDNALLLGDNMVSLVAATGEEKCDAGRYAASLLRDTGLSNVVFTTNHTDKISGRPLLCTAEGSLKKRAIRIMEAIIEPLTAEEITDAKAAECKPTVGFWGTPPHPIEVMDLFPETTHIYGWTRCVEMGVPASLQIEKDVPDNLPIVFFSQGFCSKALLAKELTKKYRGMFVDVHDGLNAATMAKIEAFIRLSSQGAV
jgi:hypothetical protein